VHCLQGLGEIYATKCRRFNLGLAELSEGLGISIVDVDSILARSGADRLKIDAMHLTPEGYQLVAEEVVRILVDLDVMPAMQEPKCEPA
jgi:lysophospholipase L1-like esterase